MKPPQPTTPENHPVLDVISWDKLLSLLTFLRENYPENEELQNRITTLEENIRKILGGEKVQIRTL